MAEKMINIGFPVSRRNRLISAELKLLLIHTKNLCIAYKHFSMNINIKIIKSLPVL